MAEKQEVTRYPYPRDFVLVPQLLHEPASTMTSRSQARGTRKPESQARYGVEIDTCRKRWHEVLCKFCAASAAALELAGGIGHILHKIRNGTLAHHAPCVAVMRTVCQSLSAAGILCSERDERSMHSKSSDLQAVPRRHSRNAAPPGKLVSLRRHSTTLPLRQMLTVGSERLAGWRQSGLAQRPSP